ncbi:NADP-dependent oxidoreductase [Leifsonia sp. NPDC080035]|uniref:NADP-dependent oxidoreductase n=1 Tax=Leifsonia sp. NPDC080035 TaxID=3143936 RepID=A0AAU7GC01_9MICO
MRAIGLVEYGGPEVLHPVTLVDPHPGPGEVRVKVEAAAVAPVDAMLRRGELAGMNTGLSGPYVPGMEVAGIIDELGGGEDHVLGLTLGMRVVGFIDNAGSHGGYSDFVVLPAASVVEAPYGTTAEESASFVNNALTALNVLQTLSLPAGATLLVSGAAGSVGGYLTQLAAHQGLQVVAIAAESDELLVRFFGAEEFVPRMDGAPRQVRELVPGGVDAAADAALIGEPILAAIKDGGQLARLRFGEFRTERGIAVHQLNVRSRATDRDAIATLRDLVNDGVITTRVARIFPAAEAADAHRLLDAGATRGRLILRFPV